MQTCPLWSDYWAGATWLAHQCCHQPYRMCHTWAHCCKARGWGNCGHSQWKRCSVAWAGWTYNTCLYIPAMAWWMSRCLLPPDRWSSNLCLLQLAHVCRCCFGSCQLHETCSVWGCLACAGTGPILRRILAIQAQPNQKSQSLFWEGEAREGEKM